MRKYKIPLLFFGVFSSLYAINVNYSIVENEYPTQIVFDNNTTNNYKIYILNSEQLLNSGQAVGVPCELKKEVHVAFENLDNKNYEAKTFLCGNEIIIENIGE